MLTSNYRINLLNFVITIFFALLIIFSGAKVIAASPNEQSAIQQNNKAQQIIENEKHDLIRQKEAEEIENIGKSRDKQEKQSSVAKPIDDKVCHIIKTFEISGNREVYAWTINRKFIKPFLKVKPDSCFTRADLAKLHDQISNYYLQKGYVLARVYFDGSLLTKETIKIVIEEGKLEKLELKDNSKLNDKLSYRRPIQKFFAFPMLQNNIFPLPWGNERLHGEAGQSDGGSYDVINLRDIEQGLDQINRLSSQSAKMVMDAGSKPGYSNITIENQIGHLATITAGADNSGNVNTGREKRKVSLNYDNFLGINDNIYLNYSRSTGSPCGVLGCAGTAFGLYDDDYNRNRRYSKALYSSISIPFGYYTFGGSYSYSNYLLTGAGTAGTFKSSGDSQAETYYIDRVLSRGQKYKISLKAELAKSDTNSYIEDTYIPTNSRKLTEGNLYLNNTVYFGNGSLYLQPKYSKGLTAFGALKDSPDLAKDKPHAQFESYGLYVQSNLNFELPLPRGSERLHGEAGQSDGGSYKSPKTEIPLNHKLTFDSTISKDSLYGSDQFSIGGRYTVRGFQESIISGDSGYLVRNDLSVKLSDITPKVLSDSKLMNFGGEKFSASSALSKMRLGVFYDYGYVRNYVLDSPTDQGYMSGTGAVLSYAGKFLNWDVTYSKGLHSPEFLRTVDNISKDNETIYFQMGISLGLL